jgi:hypothetical protein
MRVVQNVDRITGASNKRASPHQPSEEIVALKTRNKGFDELPVLLPPCCVLKRVLEIQQCRCAGGETRLVRYNRESYSLPF